MPEAVADPRCVFEDEDSHDWQEPSLWWTTGGRSFLVSECRRCGTGVLVPVYGAEG